MANTELFTREINIETGEETITYLTEQQVAELQAASQTIPIPQVVTAYQAKMALASANLYSTVENTVNTSTDVTLKIAWNNASTFDRQSPFIISIGQQLGISNTEIDNLFIAASKVI